MGRSFQSHGIKYMAAASFLVFVWFVWRLGLHTEASEKLAGMIPNKQPYTSAPQPTPAASTPSTPSTPLAPAPKNPDGSHPDILDEAAAKQYCSNFRMDAFPRDRVKQRKIYDLLLINTEMEMLEVRMGQMSSGVDYFVVLESDKTFTDKPKKLFVQENMNLFEKYKNQMIRRTMDLTTGDFTRSWDREIASRNAMYSQVIPFLTGDQAASLDDVLLVSDVDEMFKPETLKLFRNCVIPEKVTAQSDLFYYSFQWVNEYFWKHPQATFYKGKDDTILPNDLRSHGDQHHLLRNAAWHCSYCFSSINEIIKKITSFSHTEFDLPEYKDPAKIINRVRNGRDMFDRSNCTRVENNPDVPQFVKANADKFGYMLDRDPPNANFKDYKP